MIDQTCHNEYLSPVETCTSAKNNAPRISQKVALSDYKTEKHNS